MGLGSTAADAATTVLSAIERCSYLPLPALLRGEVEIRAQLEFRVRGEAMRSIRLQTIGPPSSAGPRGYERCRRSAWPLTRRGACARKVGSTYPTAPTSPRKRAGRLKRGSPR